MNSFCSYYNQGTCTSCTRIELSHREQLSQKMDLLKQLLASHWPFTLLPPVTSAPYHFRNKAKFSVTGTLEAPLIGLTGTKELDQGREILDCPLHHPRINQLVSEIKSFIPLAKLHPYHIRDQRGELKGLIIYHSSESDQTYLRFVLRSRESLDRLKKYLPHLQKEFPQLSCISANIQPTPHALLEGEEEVFLTENQFILHQLGDITLHLHPQGFVQTNQQVALALYTTAAQWAQESEAQSLVELFSGQGAFSFFLQKFVKNSLGIEINPQAVERANLTAQHLRLDHLRFISADAAQVEQVVKKQYPDLILVNPPKRGLGESVELIKKTNPDYLIYSSCNILTLAQDLEQLRDKYQIIKAQLFDMFPHTEHFEILVMLESKSPYENG
jgi:23S rRNA (uracil747-C5)-methyltransferase